MFMIEKRNERLKRSKSVEETAQNRLGFGLKVKLNTSKLHRWYLRLVDDTRYFWTICFDLSPQRSNDLAEQQRPTERKILLAKRQTVIIIGRGKVISGIDDSVAPWRAKTDNVHIASDRTFARTTSVYYVGTRGE